MSGTIFALELGNGRRRDRKQLLAFSLGRRDARAGMDGGIVITDKERNILRQKVEKFKPKTLAFNGKRAAKEFLEIDDIKYGEYLGNHGFSRTRIWILPSTSSAGARWWDEKLWQDLSVVSRKTFNIGKKGIDTIKS